MAGSRCGRLTVLSYAGTPNGRAMWACQCDCGQQSTVSGKYLRSGRTRSCGCLHKEITAAIKFSHGMSNSPTYMCWQSMKNRCHNRSQQSYKRYGALGIKVCSRWLDSFENFFADMGERPPGTTLDRKNALGNYEPGNCRWATRGEQSNNTRGQRAIILMDALVAGTISLSEAIASWSPAEAFEQGYRRLP